MRVPRWSLPAVAVVLVLPVAGPAFATAAGDGETTFLSALAASFSPAETCPEDEDAEEDVLTEDLDTAEQGEDACPEEDGDADETVEDDEGTDDDGTGDDEGEEILEEDDDPDDPDDDPTDDDLTDDELASEDEQLTHGALVSTVARCAPRGPEARELFERNHGAFVSAAAQGGEIEVLGETFDLSTPEGAEALCDLVADAPERDDEEPDTTEDEETTEEPEPEVESQQSGDARPAEAGRPAAPGGGNGKAADEAPAAPADKGVGRTQEKGGEDGGPPAHAGGGGKGGGPDR